MNGVKANAGPRMDNKSSKRGVKGKRLKAAWNHPYLLKLLGI
jgi:hypothetical protein